MLEGTVVKLGELDLVVPRVPLKAFRCHPEWFAKIDSMSGIMQPDDVTAIVSVVYSAIERNYPDMTIEQVEDLLDIGNVGDMLKVVMGPGSGEAGRP